MRETPMQKADRRRRLFGKVLSVVVGFSILGAGVAGTMLMPRNRWGVLEGIPYFFGLVMVGAALWASIRIASKIEARLNPPIPWEHQMVRESAEHRAKYPDLYPPKGR